MAPKKEMAPTGRNPIDAINRLDSNQKQQSNILIFPGNLKELRLLRAKHQKDKHPNVPIHGIGNGKPYKDSTANGLTKCIIDAINLCGGQAERISNTGRIVDSSYTYTNVIGQTKRIGSSKWIPGTGTNGTADISAIWEGRSIKIEVKIGNDNLSQDQIKYRQSVEASGGIFILARDYQSFIIEFERRIGYGC